MAKRTGRRQAALERKALKHQDFVGSADADRAESEFYEHERIEQDRAHADGAIGPEFPFRLPRPGELREKARERLERLPEPAQQALHVAGAAVQVMLVPMRIGWAFARELWRVPGQILRVFREA